MFTYDPHPVTTFSNALQTATNNELMSLAKQLDVPVKRQFVTYITVCGTRMSDLTIALEAVIEQNHLDRSTVGINARQDQIQIVGEAVYNLSNKSEKQALMQKLICAYKSSI